jgi:hypothetical protein
VGIRWPPSGVSRRQDLPIGVSCDVLVTSGFLGSFDELPLLEAGAGRTPSNLGGLDELERHRDSGGAGAGSLRELLTHQLRANPES